MINHVLWGRGVTDCMIVSEPRKAPCWWRKSNRTISCVVESGQGRYRMSRVWSIEVGARVLQNVTWVWSNFRLIQMRLTVEFKWVGQCPGYLFLGCLFNIFFFFVLVGKRMSILRRSIIWLQQVPFLSRIDYRSLLLPCIPHHSWILLTLAL